MFVSTVPCKIIAAVVHCSAAWFATDELKIDPLLVCKGMPLQVLRVPGGKSTAVVLACMFGHSVDLEMVPKELLVSWYALLLSSRTFLLET
jgi:hypothetical protein